MRFQAHDSPQAAEHPSVFRFGKFVLCRHRHCLCRGQEPIHLREKVFKTLAFLLENRGIILTRENLLDAVWADVSVIPNTVDHVIAEIRQALGDDDAKPRFIETVAGEGYCFIAHVERMPGGHLPCETKESLAILPFMTLGLGSGEEWLGEGLADALITRISNLRTIAIRPTGAVLKYSGQSRNPLEAGRELRVDLVLEGMIQRSGKQVRVTVQLLRISSGESLWGETYDEKLQNCFSLEDSICEKVVRALVPRLGSQKPQNA